MLNARHTFVINSVLGVYHHNTLSVTYMHNVLDAHHHSTFLTYVHNVLDSHHHNTLLSTCTMCWMRIIMICSYLHAQCAGCTSSSSFLLPGHVHYELDEHHHSTLLSTCTMCWMQSHFCYSVLDAYHHNALSVTYVHNVLDSHHYNTLLPTCTMCWMHIIIICYYLRAQCAGCTSS